MVTNHPIPTNHRFKDLTGLVFGRWFVAAFGGCTNNMATWLCRCECGKTRHVRSAHLQSGKSKSCGCLRDQLASVKSGTHRLSNLAEYDVWHSMKTRCYSKTANTYANYGGRGITVCNQWRDSVECFINDMGLRPSAKHSLDRIDNNKGYSPENCRWATRSMQAKNMRRTRYITHNGRTQSIHDWANETGISAEILRQRIVKYGWQAGDALHTPVRRR